MLMKKKIKDLTIEECKKMCCKAGDEFNSCANCPLTSICYMFQDCNFNILDEDLEKEVEVE